MVLAETVVRQRLQRYPILWRLPLGRTAVSILLTMIIDASAGWGQTGLSLTVAGNGTDGFSGDGGPATSASLTADYGIAVGIDGSFYFADRFSHRIRRVGTDGIITTVAGNG